MSELITVAVGVSMAPFAVKFVSRQLTHGNQATPTEPGQRPHQIQLCHIPRRCTSEAAEHERHGGNEEADASSEQIRETPIQRLERRARDEIRRRQP